MFSNYRPKYAAQPIKVKESFLPAPTSTTRAGMGGAPSVLIYQNGEIALTPAGENLHTASRRIMLGNVQEDCHYSFTHPYKN